MKRDIELIRLILLKIENEYVLTALHNLEIEGYDREQIAYHCKILAEKNMISSYNPIYADGVLYAFSVGGLTWDGNDFLDGIREPKQWRNVKNFINEKGLPFVFDIVKDVSKGLLSSMAEGAMTAIIKNTK